MASTKSKEWSLGLPRCSLLLGNLLLFHAFDQANFTFRSTLANVFVFGSIAALIELVWFKQKPRDEGSVAETKNGCRGESTRPLASPEISLGGSEEAPLLEDEEDVDSWHDALDKTPAGLFAEKKTEGKADEKDARSDTADDSVQGENNRAGPCKEADIFLHHLIDQDGKKIYFGGAPGCFFPFKDDDSDGDSSEEESEDPPPLCYHAPFHGRIACVTAKVAKAPRNVPNRNTAKASQCLSISKTYNDSLDDDSSEGESEGPPPLCYHGKVADVPAEGANTNTTKNVSSFGTLKGPSILPPSQWHHGYSSDENSSEGESEGPPALCFHTPIDVKHAGATADEFCANNPRDLTDANTSEVSYGLTDSVARSLSLSKRPEIQTTDDHHPTVEDKSWKEVDFLEKLEAINSLFEFPERESYISKRRHTVSEVFPAEHQEDSSSSSSEGNWRAGESYMLELAEGGPWVDLKPEGEMQQNDESRPAAGGFREELCLVSVDGFAILKDASEEEEAQSSEEGENIIGERANLEHSAKTTGHRRIHTLRRQEQSHDLKEPAARASALPDSTEVTPANQQQPAAMEGRYGNDMVFFEGAEIVDQLLEAPRREPHAEQPRRMTYEALTGERQRLRGAWGHSSPSSIEEETQESKHKSPYGSIGFSGGFALMASCAILQDADTSEGAEAQSVKDDERMIGALSVEANCAIAREEPTEFPPEVPNDFAPSDVLRSIAQHAPTELQTVDGLLSMLPSQADSEQLASLSASLPTASFQARAKFQREGEPTGNGEPTMAERQLRAMDATATLNRGNRQIKEHWSSTRTTANAANSSILQQQPKRNANNRPKKYKVNDKTHVLKSLLYEVESKTLKANKTIWRALLSAKRRAKRGKKSREGATRRGRYKCNLCQQQLGDSHDCPFVSVSIDALWELRPHLPIVPDYLNRILDKHDQSMQKKRPAEAAF